MSAGAAGILRPGLDVAYFPLRQMEYMWLRRGLRMLRNPESTQESRPVPFKTLFPLTLAVDTSGEQPHLMRELPLSIAKLPVGVNRYAEGTHLPLLLHSCFSDIKTDAELNFKTSVLSV